MDKLISLQDAIKAIDEKAKRIKNEDTLNGLAGAVGILFDLPSVTQKSGVWVEIDDEPHEVWECDHCGFVIDGSGCIEPYEYRDTYKFCPNCGCAMFEPQESEE